MVKALPKLLTRKEAFHE